MVRYYLLRDNHETGPYTLTELKGKTLFSTDLLWIEGESTCWKVPTEIPGLESISLAVKKQVPARPKLRSATGSKAKKSEQVSRHPAGGGMDFSDTYLPPDDYIPPSFESLKEKYAQKKPQKPVWKRQVSFGANLMGLFTLIVGLGISAYMIKKAVENIELQPVIASAESVPISPETLPNSTTSHAAFAALLPTAKRTVLDPDTTIVPTTLASVNVTENRLPPAGDQPKEPLEKKATTERKESNQELQQKEATDPGMIRTASESTGSATADIETVAKAETEKKEAEEKPAAKPALRLSANKYDVGFLGGISNLQISITNPSSEEVSKALVEVEFLRKNGKVVGSQTVTVSGIAPGGSKTVSVPDNSRGVSVRYKVIKTES